MPIKSPEPVDRHVGSRVRMHRLMIRMSQGALADQIGVTFQQVQKYEKGKNRISASRLQQIAAILNVPAHSFFEGGPESRDVKRRDNPSTCQTRKLGLAVAQLIAEYVSVVGSEVGTAAADAPWCGE